MRTCCNGPKNHLVSCTVAVLQYGMTHNFQLRQSSSLVHREDLAKLSRGGTLFTEGDNSPESWVKCGNDWLSKMSDEPSENVLRRIRDSFRSANDSVRWTMFSSVEKVLAAKALAPQQRHKLRQEVRCCRVLAFSVCISTAAHLAEKQRHSWFLHYPKLPLHCQDAGCA